MKKGWPVFKESAAVQSFGSGKRILRVFFANYVLSYFGKEVNQRIKSEWEDHKWIRGS